MKIKTYLHYIFIVYKTRDWNSGGTNDAINNHGNYNNYDNNDHNLITLLLVEP